MAHRGRRRRPVSRRLAPLGLALLLLASAGAQEQELGYGAQPRATEGWFTLEQAERGGEAYERHCAGCHGVELEGVVGFSPPLAGSDFLQRWHGDDVATLFHYVRSLMPLDAPSTLSDDTYVDIVAYLLHENELPAGEHELRFESGQLGRLVLPPPDESGGAADD